MSIGENLESDVKIPSLAPGRPDILFSIPEKESPKGLWFTLKEGSKYNLQFTFRVSNNLVSGLKYTITIWKTGVKGNPLIQNTIYLAHLKDYVLHEQRIIVTVYSAKEMMGIFSPKAELYT
ncbi:rho GDP-dissociation inhibitor 1-like [Hibiscus syriacus]|uniref:rho GDP-dissociation inhibitor 1-like n=1 Tax=Hibiscus syriacus TaxID=106335 RepID=UPI001923AC86|nr:rho GDP-dissociation inhibitor 1-like [Hibiscus syriacus]